jgi:Cytochrome b5-like Heme/Steroid binding domain
MSKLKLLGLLLSLLVIFSAGTVYYLQNMPKAQAPITDDKKVTLTYITKEELASKTTKENCWLSVAGKVYDVTKYANKHPGGKELYNGCGKVLDELFKNHPGGPFDSAKNLQTLKEFEVGDLKK